MWVRHGIIPGDVEVVAVFSTNERRRHVKVGGENVSYPFSRPVRHCPSERWMSASRGCLHQLSEALAQELWLIGTHRPGKKYIFVFLSQFIRLRLTLFECRG